MIKEKNIITWWRSRLPGFSVIGLVLIARALGLFQGSELKTFDAFLRLRPAEPKDERILIIGINEADIQQAGTYPIPDQQLANLLQILSKSNPRAIGIDVIRDLPVEPGHDAFRDMLEQTPNVIGVERISTDLVSPHTLPPEQVGFIDLPLDPDGFVRRTYLGAFPPLEHPDSDRFRYALAFLLAEAYLYEEGFLLSEGQQNPGNMRFGETELFSLQPNAGSYIGNDAGGVQMLINVRSGDMPFDVVSMTDVLSGQVNRERIEDRIVLIGIASLSVKDVINSGATHSQNPGLVNGVEMHAHIASQLLSTVLEGRQQIRVLPDGWEYFLIALVGGLGMWLPRVISRPIRYALALIVVAVGLVSGGVAALWVGGCWIPVVPSIAVFALNAGILPAFYLYDRELRSRIEARQRVIEQSYDTIHNGPLQTLSLLLKNRDALPSKAAQQLETLNSELRQVYERLLDKSVPQENQLALKDNQVIDLRSPFHEVLYEVYDATLARAFPAFETIRLKVVKFEPLAVAKLQIEDKRALCRFLEEALCNVGKHALGTKRLIVNCLATETENLILVKDSGGGIDESQYALTDDGRGTQQAAQLAQRLQGYFKRSPTPFGTTCEIRWPLSK